MLAERLRCSALCALYGANVTRTERQMAMRRVEELIASNMVLVLRDWELYRAVKAKR
jgi:hypothetical protein